MRTNEEILNDSNNEVHNTRSHLILEVLLDIRDILYKDKGRKK